MTQTEIKVLRTLINFIKTNGFSPTIRELGKLVELKSSSTGHSYIKKLEVQGYITTIEFKSRTIKINEELIKKNNIEI